MINPTERSTPVVSEMKKTRNIHTPGWLLFHVLLRVWLRDGRTDAHIPRLTLIYSCLLRWWEWSEGGPYRLGSNSCRSSAVGLSVVCVCDEIDFLSPFSSFFWWNPLAKEKKEGKNLPTSKAKSTAYNIIRDEERKNISYFFRLFLLFIFFLFLHEFSML